MEKDKKINKWFTLIELLITIVIIGLVFTIGYNAVLSIINSSKETITSSIMASLDNPNGIINEYYAKQLVDSELFEERINKFNEVTKQDIINVSKKVSIYSILTLEKGEDNEDN